MRGKVHLRGSVCQVERKKKKEKDKQAFSFLVFVVKERERERAKKGGRVKVVEHFASSLFSSLFAFLFPILE